MPTKISFRSKIGYGAGEFSSSIFFTITSFWLMNFLTDEVGLSAALAGTGLLVGKVWDAVIDPFIGHFSDHTRSPWGRRRPYLLFFAIPLGAAFVLMFRNPGIEDQVGKFVWATLTYVFFCTVYSFTNIPYNSLLPEMTNDYNERTNISGYKQGYAVIGTLIGAGAAMPIIGLLGGGSAGFAGMGAVFGFLAALSLLVTFFSVREPAVSAKPHGENVTKSLKDVFSNRPYKLLVSAWFTNSTAMAILQTMLIYYYKYILNDEAGVTLAMITLLVVSLLAIPFWVWAARKIGKKNAYMLGMAMTVVTVLVMAFAGHLLGAGTLGLMALAGVGFSSHYVLPWSIAPDTIEYGYYRTGVRREGIYYSVWTFVIALGGALAGFLVGQGLNLFGYVPNVAQSSTSALGIRLLIGPLPTILILLGNLALFFYPLDKNRYEEVVRTLQAREAGQKDPSVEEDDHESNRDWLGSLGIDRSTGSGESGLEGRNLRAG